MRIEIVDEQKKRMAIFIFRPIYGDLIDFFDGPGLPLAAAFNRRFFVEMEASPQSKLLMYPWASRRFLPCCIPVS